MLHVDAFSVILLVLQRIIWQQHDKIVLVCVATCLSDISAELRWVLLGLMSLRLVPLEVIRY